MSEAQPLTADIELAEDEPTGTAFGRPTKYRPEYAEQAKKLCRLGATDVALADFFNVTTRTITRWKSEHEDFCLALTVAKEEADEAVERSLYHKAVGYEQEAVKIFLPKDSSTPVYAPYREKIAPDTGAAIFWLKNRRRDRWRDRTEQDVNVNVTLSGEFEALVKQIKHDDVLDLEPIDAEDAKTIQQSK